MSILTDNDGWKLDKHIPVAVLIGLMLNAGAGIWYASQFESRLGQVEKQFPAYVAQVADIDRARQDTNVRLTKIDDQITVVLDIVKRLETQRR